MCEDGGKGGTEESKGTKGEKKMKSGWGGGDERWVNEKK